MMADLQRVIEIVAGTNGAVVQGTNVWEDCIAYVMATWMNSASRPLYFYLPILTHISVGVRGLRSA